MAASRRRREKAGEAAWVEESVSRSRARCGSSCGELHSVHGAVRSAGRVEDSSVVLVGRDAVVVRT